MTEVTVFKALADETRLRLMNLLVHSEGSLCVCEQMDALRLRQNVVSKHLAILRAAGMVEGKRRGTWTYYAISRDASGLVRSLIPVLRKRLESRVFRIDLDRLEKRLALRRDDVCVVGFRKSQR